MGLKDKLANDGSPHSRLGGTFADSSAVGQRTGGYSSIKSSQLHASYQDVNSQPTIAPSADAVDGERSVFHVGTTFNDLDGKTPSKYQDNTPEGVPLR